MLIPLPRPGGFPPVSMARAGRTVSVQVVVFVGRVWSFTEDAPVFGRAPGLLTPGVCIAEPVAIP